MCSHHKLLLLAGSHSDVLVVSQLGVGEGLVAGEEGRGELLAETASGSTFSLCPITHSHYWKCKEVSVGEGFTNQPTLPSATFLTLTSSEHCASLCVLGTRVLARTSCKDDSSYY